jgi:hypothetical protein
MRTLMISALEYNYGTRLSDHMERSLGMAWRIGLVGLSPNSCCRNSPTRNRETLRPRPVRAHRLILNRGQAMLYTLSHRISSADADAVVDILTG